MQTGGDFVPCEDQSYEGLEKSLLLGLLVSMSHHLDGRPFWNSLQTNPHQLVAGGKRREIRSTAIGLAEVISRTDHAALQ